MQNMQCLEAESYLPINLILQLSWPAMRFIYLFIFVHVGFLTKALNYRVQFGEFPVPSADVPSVYLCCNSYCIIISVYKLHLQYARGYLEIEK